jgi:hypothetical protein
MAKVKIQGHASGSGVLTVTAPNTSTDRTITLPDATGTLLNSNGDGSSLTGVADATKLPLAGGSMTNMLWVTGTNANNANNVGLGIWGGTTSQGIYARGNAASTNSFGLDSTGTTTFTQAGTERVKISSAGVLSASAGIELGSGLDATAANTLNDYEEGTWTPSVLTGSGVSIGTVYANSYIKIGKVCTLSASFQVNSTNTPSAYDIRFGGFPFSFAAFDNGGYPISLMYSHRQTPTLFMSRGGYVYYQGTTVGGNNAEPFGSALLNGSNYLSFAFSYHTT